MTAEETSDKRLDPSYLKGIFSKYFLRFSTVGALATIVYFIAGNLIVYFTEIADSHASVMAYLCGMMVSFHGQRSYTFKKEGQYVLHWVRFLLFSVVGLVLSYYILIVNSELLGLPAVVGFLATAVLIPVLSFFIMHFWIFK